MLDEFMLVFENKFLPNEKLDYLTFDDVDSINLHIVHVRSIGP